MELLKNLTRTNIIIITCIIIAIILYVVHRLSSKKMILFYSDSCGHCKTFKPEWQRIKDSGLATTSEINCEKDSASCNSYNIQGYPTILVESGFSTTEYSGPRTMDSLIKFYDSR
jgi:thiol-disulfide isomerase/thioredoxin